MIRAALLTLALLVVAAAVHGQDEAPKMSKGVTIATKAFYVEGQLVIRHGRHFSVVMFFSKRPDEERLKVLKEVAKIFLPRVPKV